MKVAIWISIGVISTMTLQVCGAAIITPVDVGSASGFQKIAEFFDAQPTTTPTEGITTDDFGAIGSFYEDDTRAVYLDFGTNWGMYTIQEVWFGLKQYGSNPNGVAPQTFWSSSNDPDYEPGNGDVLTTSFNMYSWTGNTSEKSWQRIWTGSQDVGNRYYIMYFDGTQADSNRTQEIVFTGIPEPATAVLLGLGAMALLLLRRRLRR